MGSRRAAEVLMSGRLVVEPDQLVAAPWAWREPTLAATRHVLAGA
jgi:hypothetical protein